MLNQFSRTELLIGKENIEKLKNAKVAVFGIGGVGSFVVEGLVRAGVENFILVDDDKICLTNLNRQIIATHKTVGKYKVEVAKERILEINPNAKVETYQEFFMPDSKEIIDNTEYNEEDIYRLMGLQENEKMLSLDETVGDSEDTSLVDFVRSTGLTPEDEVMKANLTERMAEEIDKLSDKERQVVTLYYYEELTMKEVAEVLDITESRVSQIHTSAMQKLKRRLKDIYE